jgi:hypothetical protein
MFSPRPPCPPSPAVGVRPEGIYPEGLPALQKFITLAVGLLDQQPDVPVDEEPQQETWGEDTNLSLSPCGRGIKGEGDSGSSHPRTTTKNQNPVLPGFWFFFCLPTAYLW